MISLRLRDAISNSSFVAPLAVFFFAASLSACGKQQSDEDDKPVIFYPVTGAAARALSEAYFKPFEEETGIEVRIVRVDDQFGPFQAQRAAGRIEYDLLNYDNISIASEPEVFEDHGLELPDDYFFDVSFPGKSVPAWIETFLVIACNEDLVDRCPRTYAEFFDDEAFPGDRSLPNMDPYGVLGVMEAALLADGVQRQDLYPLDLDRAFSKLEGVKDSIRLFWTSATGSQDVLRSGEISISLMFDGRASQLVIEQGMNLSISYIDVNAYVASFVIPKGAPNADEARSFMKWAIDNPKAQAVFSTKLYYGPVSAKGVEYLREFDLPTHTSMHLDKARMLTREEVETASQWMKEHRSEMMDRWNEFTAR